jgi:hypothetical protein
MSALLSRLPPQIADTFHPVHCVSGWIVVRPRDDFRVLLTTPTEPKAREVADALNRLYPAVSP